MTKHKDPPRRWKRGDSFGCYFPNTDLNVGEMGGRGTGCPKGPDVEWLDEIDDLPWVERPRIEILVHTIRLPEDREAICGRRVRMRGVPGWYYVIQYGGVAENGRHFWLCCSPNRTIIESMLPDVLEMSSDKSVPREVSIWYYERSASTFRRID